MALTGTQQLFDLVEKARAAALKCPGGVVTGAAGLVLADCELPPRLEKLACEAPVQISLPRARSYFHDVPAHRHAVPAGPWLTIDRV
ncbi:MAG: hypothetical protein LBK95_06245, partial [Bifidobacteriaceae bacterium]|nr:hypothetical protein [Bifidobacteriaceae bacterium]